MRGRPSRAAPRLSLKDQHAKNVKIMRALGVPEDKLVTPASLAHLDKPKRAYTKREGPTEADVLTQIRQLLALRQDVAFVWRLQSGLFIDGDRHIRVGFRGMPDLIGMLRGGRLFCIEVKRPNGVHSVEQTETIAWVKSQGGLAGFASSIEEALQVIEGKV